ncbi:MAG: hypothetical protein L0G99_14540 [Propionibacteriales bacterium]|nr:hypothetical protein [Propionibacteriales bacterium]
MRVLRAELAKLLSLPFARVAVVTGLVVPPGIAVISNLTSEPGTDNALAAMAVGVLGAIILGVIAISSEYTVEGEESAGGSQITTTLTAAPIRWRVLVAKAAAVILVTVPMTILALALITVSTRLLWGPTAMDLGPDTLVRMAGVITYWVLTALIGLAVTILTRNGIVPMAIMIANSSAVTVTYLLARSFSWANYLPDLAGLRMFTGLDTGVHLTPGTGGLIMVGWTALLMIIAGVVFWRRDA